MPMKTITISHDGGKCQYDICHIPSFTVCKNSLSPNMSYLLKPYHNRAIRTQFNEYYTTKNSYETVDLYIKNHTAEMSKDTKSFDLHLSLVELCEKQNLEQDEISMLQNNLYLSEDDIYLDNLKSIHKFKTLFEKES
jgi:hypothetical protein